MDPVEPDHQLDPYTEVARRFFNEFLELRVSVQQGVKQAPQHNKEIALWRKANNELKRAASELSERVTELETMVTNLEENNAELQRRLNEALIRGKLVERVEQATREYPFTEHMSEASFREWQKLLSEIPRHR